MKFFREKYTRKIMTVFTGLVFLNLSFFLAEITTIKIVTHNKQLVENLVRIFATVSEEERDAGGCETQDTGFSSVKEVDLCLDDHVKSIDDWYVILLKEYLDTHKNLTKSVISETPSQPPEV